MKELTEELYSELKNVKSDDEAIALLNGEGINVNKSDLMKSLYQYDKVELDDDDLSMVTGGVDFISIFVQQVTKMGREKLTEVFSQYFNK